MTPEELARRTRIGWIATLIVACVYGGLALTVNFRSAAVGFQSDEATYHLMAHSLAADGDLEYRQEDLVRAFREFPSGPSGIFLKRGVDVTGMRLSTTPPFVEFPGTPDPDPSRLYFGKSFIYPLAAAPFVWLFGTNGFLLLNALLLAAAFMAAYTFTSARSGIRAGLLWASAFVFASVIPVYVVWTAPELFNWAVAVIAYFLWLYKIGVSADVLPESSSFRKPWTDFAAAALIGLLTFSKVTNVLLLLPMIGWWLWTRAWSRALVALTVWAVFTAAGFGGNVATSGEWNYQGGDRATCYGPFPYQDPARGFEVCAERGRSEALGDVIFAPDMFWTNLRANLVYFFVGRNSGMAAYYFPGVFAILALAVAWRSRTAWQSLIVGGIAIQILLFIVTLPYSYFGGGGTVGNRYFTGVYAACVFVLPVLRDLRWLLVPWVIGSLFVAKLILSPFQVSIRPADHAKSGVFRLLPVELTNLNELPLMTESDRIRIWYGDTGEGNPGFQIYYLDDNSYLQEADKLSFWIRGESRAQIVIKTDKLYSRMRVTLTAGPIATDASVSVNGQRSDVSLSPGQSSQVMLPLGPGFPYKKSRETPAYVWVMDLTSSSGFVPALTNGSHDRRFLGVMVKPIIVE